jgi:hypothetical protein
MYDAVSQNDHRAPGSALFGRTPQIARGRGGNHRRDPIWQRITFAGEGLPVEVIGIAPNANYQAVDEAPQAHGRRSHGS